MPRPPRTPGIAPWVRAASTLLVSVVLAGPALAQPYAAAGGFGRPVAIAANDAVPAAGIAIDGAGTVHVAYADAAGVWTLAPGDDAQPVLVARSDAARHVWAGTVGGRVAVAWIERDRTTGESRHFLAWDGSTIELFRDRVAVPLRVVAIDDRPWVLLARRAAGVSEIVLREAMPASGTPSERLLHRTELSVRGPDVAIAADGTTLLSWLEGKTDRTEFGLVAEWDAYVARLPGRVPVAVADVLALGAADVIDERQRTAVALLEDRGLVAWPGEDGRVRVSQVAFGRAGEAGQAAEKARVSSTVALEAGRPLAVTAHEVIWVSGDAIRRATWDPEQGAVEAEIVSLAWSPVTIEGAEMALGPRVPADAAGEALQALAWYGRRQGGGVAVFASDDRVAMPRTWRDRLAAAMGWRPWAVWEEAVGQALTAVLVGIVVTIASAPLLWVVALIASGWARMAAARTAAEPGCDAAVLVRSGRRVTAAAARMGAGLGLTPMVLAAALLAWRGAAFDRQPLSTLAFVAAVAAVSWVLGATVARRGDREPQLTTLLAALLTAAVSVTVVAFASYRSWAPVLGLT